jgi:hypothetical protein
MLNKIKNSQQGISLIITFFIMIIILSAVLSISALLYSEIKVIRNMGNSVASFYAAESGIEKVLFYDRQVIPDGATRGLCSMFDSCVTGSSGETSIYCNNPTPSTFTGGCDPNVCNNCQITFNTVFDGNTYYVTAKVFPNSAEPSKSDFEIDSKGVYPVGGAQRQIQILMTP